MIFTPFATNWRSWIKLNHSKFSDPDQTPFDKADPYYWNFLEMEFDPAQKDPKIGMRIRNLVDSPSENPRGGGSLETMASTTGRVPNCKLPPIKTIPNADVFFTESNGKPIRGSRSDGDGVVHVSGLVDVKPGDKVVVTAFDGEKSASQVVENKS